MNYLAACLLAVVAIRYSAVAAQACPTKCRCSGGVVTSVDCSRLKLSEVPDLLPNSTSVLTLAHNLIVSLVDGQFKGLVNLTSLDLSSNKLSSMSPNAFAGCCSRLQTLVLTNNYLAAVPSSAFASLPSLRQLHLTENYLTSVPSLGDGGRLLEELYLENNRLSSAAFPSSYNTSVALTRVTLSNNKGLLILAARDFENLRGCPLRRLYLSRCELSSVEPGSLGPIAAHISSLTFTDNPLAASGALAVIAELREAKQLVSLSLTRVQFEAELTADAFAPLKGSSLQVLEIAHNSISKVGNQAFANMPHLKILDMTDVKMQELSAHAFDGLASLDLLVLADNSLVNLPALFPPKITKLVLSGNALMNLATNQFASLTKLLRLDLSRNRLERIQAGAFYGLGSLTWLDVSRNFVPSLSPQAFVPLTSLRFLNASYNRMKLQNTDSLFTSQGNLMTLDLSYNQLDCIASSVFKGLDALKSLNLSHNNLGTCFANMTRGSELFGNVRTLYELDLSANVIYALPPALFHRLTQLQHLKLSQNKLIGWDDLDLFYGDNNLTHLSLEENQISLLNATSFASLPGLRAIYLNSNPLACSCDMVWFRSWVNRTSIELIDLADYVCHSPQNMAGQPFLRFDTSTIVCKNPTPLLIIISLSCAFICFIVILLVTYRYRWKLRFKVYRMMTRTLSGRTSAGYEAVKGCNVRYTAYLSYCREAECRKVVLKQILPRIDNDSDFDNFGKFSVHVSDKFDPSKSVVTNIVEAIDSSALVLVFLCEHYRSARVCEMELELALAPERLCERRGGCDDDSAAMGHAVVVLRVGTVLAKHVPKVLRPMFEREEYFQWTEEDQSAGQLFWAKLTDRLEATGFPLVPLN